MYTLNVYKCHEGMANSPVVTPTNFPLFARRLEMRGRANGENGGTLYQLTWKEMIFAG